MCESAFDPLIRFVRLRKLSACALFALAGCLIAAKVSLSEGAFGLITAVSLALCVLLFKRKKRIAVFLMLISVMFFFSFYSAYRDQRPVFSVNKKGSITGVVCNHPYYQPDKNRTILHLDEISLDGRAFEHKAYVYVYGNNEEGRYEYGQTLKMPEASLWIPDGQTNPDGFDFSAYLWRKGIAVCASSSVSKTEIASEKASLTRGLYRFGDFLSERFDELFTKNAGVMRAILLGDRSELDDETYESFQEAGVAHLVALSGLHVTCVAVFFEYLLMMFLIPAKPRGVITVVFIFLYTKMTGASASLMRAAMMYSLVVAARFSGNPSDLLTRLSFAFLVQLLINPLMIHDTGMQLSYLSVLSLALMARPVRELLPYFRPKRGEEDSAAIIFYNQAADAICSSAGVQFGTLPSMARLFHSVPVLSVPVNLIVVPMGLFTVYIGASALILSFASMSAAAVLGKAADAVWTVILSLTRWVSGISFSMMNTRAWSGWAIAVYFALMVFASPFFTKERRKACVRTAAAAAMAVIMLLWPAPVHRGVEVVFLDSGYADSCVVLAENNAFVYDCGKDNRITADFLTGLGANVQGIFISHPDVDHSGGLGEILRRYPNAEIYVSECWDRMDVGELVSKALSGKTLNRLKAGDVVALSDEVSACVVWPEAGFAPREDNDGSLVLHVSYGQTSALLTGDITERVDQYASADADILKVAHHGSKKATSETFLNAVTPEIAVISVSSNGHGHPTEEVLSRLADMDCEVYRTDCMGAITIRMEKDGTYQIKTELPLGG